MTGNGNTGVPMNPNPALTTSTSLTGATNSATNPSHETGVNTGSGGSTNIVTPPSSATATVVIPGTDNGATTKGQDTAGGGNSNGSTATTNIQGGNNEPGNQPGTNTTGEPVGTTDTQSVESISQPTTLSQQTTSSLISTPLASTFDGSGSIVQHSGLVVCVTYCYFYILLVIPKLIFLFWLNLFFIYMISSKYYFFFRFWQIALLSFLSIFWWGL